MNLLLRDVEVAGRRVDVRVDGGRVAAIGPGLERDGDGVDGRGGALLPGLHDHHIHLLALVAARSSVDCARGLDGLRTAPGRWARGVGSPDPLDRHALDAVVPDRPVRVQHRGGALWMLNTMALAEVAHALDDSADVERDADGVPTGRLWRYDARLRAALDDPWPDLDGVVAELRGHGITGVTDATPDLAPTAVARLEALPLRVACLGAPGGSAPRKLLLRDHDLPSWDELRAVVAETHALGRPVAVHCVTRESLVLTLAVLEDVGPRPGDRIEHASVVPPEVVDRIVHLGLRVVTQPDLLRTRGDDYLRDVDPADLPDLYPLARLARAGVPVHVSSDAPFGDPDPWRAIRSAVERRTAAGVVIGVGETITARAALAGYLTDADGRPRRVQVGAPADLCLLHVPLETALADPGAGLVRRCLTAAREASPHG
jgi:predicted amidohydrolase YtcJ